ncbi:MAG: folylpolyglutamate synthase/dihydrofolate synthase family protein [Faecalimonas sp.]|nr:folylpolyglutamate synthase/dihydrofolate synthase family protein [Faecalimonas sp.]
MTAEQAISYIHSMVWNRRATGYEHARILLEKMGNPEKSLKYIHIGGTNGKGSTAVMLASVLQKAGYKTGLYTSPYIYRFNERIRINGEEISDADLAEVTEYVKGFVDTLPECPSEFALVCCIAFAYFAKQECDIVVLEVGMGGEKDSTNVIACPELAILTNIGLDHTEYLGDTLEEIAKTKAGILKHGGDAVIYPNTPSVEGILKEICKEREIRYVFPDFGAIALKEHSLEGQCFSYRGQEALSLALLGQHQLENAAVVLEAVAILRQKGWKITEEQLRQGLQEVRWPGRFEVMSREPLFIVDGGHNPQCIEALSEGIQDYLADRRIIAITGVMEDKDYLEMYRQVMPHISEFVCVTPPSPRSMKAEKLAKKLRSLGAKASACDSVKEAIALALQLAGSDGAVLCFGSLYAVGEIRASFEELIR